MPYYSLRITTLENFNFVQINQSLENFIKDNNIDEYLFVQEVGTETEKPHYQGGFQSTKNLQTLRKSFKKHFPLSKGNECYSLKATKHKTKELCDKGIYNYCSKEYTDDSIYRSSFTVNQIIDFKTEWLKNKEIIKECKKQHTQEQDTIINQILKDIWKDGIVHNRDKVWILSRICTLVGKLDMIVHTAFIEKIYKKALQKCGPHYLSTFYFEQLQTKLLSFDPDRKYVEYSGKPTDGTYYEDKEHKKCFFQNSDELDD